MARELFFEQSFAAFEQITDLFDFVWPTSAAMWNLRWQVAGYMKVNPRATVGELESRFVSGSDIHGANLMRSCIDNSWQEQQGRFARFLLVDTLSIYESWLHSVLASLRQDSVENEKDLQFPTNVSARGKLQGVGPALKRITTPPSSVLSGALYPQFLRHSKNSLSNLENILLCYRYFKECRNTLVHSGGTSTQATLDAFAAFQAVANPKQLDFKVVPEHTIPTPGTKIELRLRGVVGFSGLVLRLIATLDAELSRAAAADNLLEGRWRRVHQQPYTLPKKGSPERQEILARLVRKLGLPTPLVTPVLEKWALARRLVN